MYLKIAGFALFFCSLIIVAIMFSGFQVYQHTERFVSGNFTTGVEPVMDIPVHVPPLNSSEGWVGFNFTLSEDHIGYEAYGILLPWNASEHPSVVMRVVNDTGISLLQFDYFSEEAWNATRVYAAAILNSTVRYFMFEFKDVDTAPLYHALFRGLENGTKSSIVMISIKESWLELAPFIPINSMNVGVSGVLAVGGAFFLVYSFWDERSRSKHRKLKRRLSK
jgi:hypothetical protein